MVRVGLDNENRVIGIATVGGFENDIEISENDVYQDIIDNPHLYKFVDGEFVLDNERKEKQDAEKQIAEIMSELEEIDVKTARPSRAIIRAFVRDETPNPTDVERIVEADSRTEELRTLLKEKSALIKKLDKS